MCNNNKLINNKLIISAQSDYECVKIREQKLYRTKKRVNKNRIFRETPENLETIIFFAKLKSALVEMGVFL